MWWYSEVTALLYIFEKKLKIGQYLAKKWTKVCSLRFGPPCTACGFELVAIDVEMAQEN